MLIFGATRENWKKKTNCSDRILNPFFVFLAIVLDSSLFYSGESGKGGKKRKAMGVIQRISFGTKVAIFLCKKTWKTKKKGVEITHISTTASCTRVGFHTDKFCRFFF
jgi:hypothetical protein